MLTIQFDNDRHPQEEDLYILFADNRSDLVLLEFSDNKVIIPNPQNLTKKELSYIGRFNGQVLWSGFVHDDSDSPYLEYSEERLSSLPPGTRFFIKMRNGLRLLDEELYMPLCRASMVAYWRKTHRFCGSCSSRLRMNSSELSLNCPSCKSNYYPQITPAIIVAIRHDRKILMIRNKRSLSKFYSLVAGYVEVGENLEEAVHREVMEETNLKITNLKYISSQAWPFPNSQMLGFTADYESGELKIQEEELLDAQWFSAEDIPPMPPRLSIGRCIVEDFIREMGIKLSSL